MTFEKRTISVGRREYEVIHCRGEGQCTCKSCEEAGKYGRHWTDWMYKLSEESEELFCIDCLKEKFINERENEAYLRGFEDGNEYATKIEELATRNDYLEKENKQLWDSYHKGYAAGYEYGKQDAKSADKAEPKRSRRENKDDNQPLPGQISIFDADVEWD